MEEPTNTKNKAERDIVIKDMVVHVKSIFGDKTTLDKAIFNMVARKAKENDKK